MLLSIALSTASRNRALLETSAAPSFAATVISRMRREKILPRLASVAALRCLMFAHLLWPAMDQSIVVTTPKLYAPIERSPVRKTLGITLVLLREKQRGARAESTLRP